VSKYIVFDLDDTLYNELDFLKSAYKEIAALTGNAAEYERMMTLFSSKKNVFEDLALKYSLELAYLLDVYRNHLPDIKVNPDFLRFVEAGKRKGYSFGLLTDGRSVTQRNKIKALGLETVFDKIIISEEFGSEKPNEKNYRAFMAVQDMDFYYIADNPGKDFITPNKLGWKTICILDNGHNIHKQDFDLLEQDYMPQWRIKDLTALNEIIE